MRIVFFDSGVGGLTVLREAVRKLPSESYAYYADTLNVPYGVHSREEVYEFVVACIDDIMRSCEVKAIVIACNTATSAAIEELRDRYAFPIIGMEPAVKPALQYVQQSGGRVLVTATPLTLKERKFQTLVRKLQSPEQVDTLGLPGLVEFAERGVFGGPEVVAYLREQFAPFELQRYGAIVLGCTHFVFFRDSIREVVPPHVVLMDGNDGTVNQLIRVLGTNVRERAESAEGILFMSSKGTEEDKRKLSDFTDMTKYRYRASARASQKRKG
ncbi:glutamate racemase [Paenibacillus ginsengarvi]|uniref:Glutamate racemase n=1 Tax=Paenibacillus ginsengarvi TaxID=400777 RepID=A0A3B0CGW9_9BACL|nr:glutamate racemase [Paenibacillus ginsengarvi]RKN84221.1 glutamate racemase [Paenibacillus ginsengarvi]